MLEKNFLQFSFITISFLSMVVVANGVFSFLNINSHVVQYVASILILAAIYDALVKSILFSETVFCDFFWFSP